MSCSVRSGEQACEGGAGMTLRSRDFAEQASRQERRGFVSTAAFLVVDSREASFQTFEAFKEVVRGGAECPQRAAHRWPLWAVELLETLRLEVDVYDLPPRSPALMVSSHQLRADTPVIMAHNPRTFECPKKSERATHRQEAGHAQATQD